MMNDDYLQVAPPWLGTEKEIVNEQPKPLTEGELRLFLRAILQAEEGTETANQIYLSHEFLRAENARLDKIGEKFATKARVADSALKISFEELKALRARVKESDEDLNSVQDLGEIASESYNREHDKATSAEAEVARLREALKPFVDDYLERVTYVPWRAMENIAGHRPYDSVVKHKDIRFARDVLAVGKEKVVLYEWFCSECKTVVPGEHVTFHEAHDERAGGCSSKVFARLVETNQQEE